MPVQTRARYKRQRTEEGSAEGPLVENPADGSGPVHQANRASQQERSAERRHPLQEILNGLRIEQARQLKRNRVFNQANALTEGQIVLILRRLATQGETLLLQAALYKDLKQTTEQQQQQIHHLQMKDGEQVHASCMTGSLPETAGSRELQTATGNSIDQNTVAPGSATLQEEEADLRDRFTGLLSRQAASRSDREDFKLWVEATLESMLDRAMEAADNRWGLESTDSEANGPCELSLSSR